MKPLYNLAIAALLAISAISCRKDTIATPTTIDPPAPCTAIMYGYSTGLTASNGGPYPACTVGTCSPSTTTTSVLGSINIQGRSNIGVYNTADNSYYTFSATYYNSTLCRVSAGGTVSYYTLPTGDSTMFRGFAYDAFNHKLLVIKHSTIDSVGEIIISGTNYTIHATTPVNLGTYTPWEITTNPNNGDLYIGGIDLSATVTTFKIGKILSGSSATIPVDSSTTTYIGQLKYNTSDNLLYGIQVTSPATTVYPYKLAKVNPACGHTELATLAMNYNSDFHTATLDACNNRYIISTAMFDSTINTWSEDSGTIYQFDLAGNLMQKNNTAGFYNAIDVKY